MANDHADVLPQKLEKHETLHWVNMIRLVLALCLIYYHNHRIVDSYKYNMTIVIPDEYTTLLSLIKASQRTTLQVGLNLVGNMIYFYKL